MALYKPNATNVKPADRPVGVTAESVETILHNTQDIPLSNIRNVLEGIPFTLDFYQPITGTHDDVSPLDLEKPPTLQSYHLVERMEVRMTSPVTSSYDAETSTFVYTAEATFYPGLQPSVNAYVSFKGPDGRMFLMRVQEVTPASYMAQSIYETTLVGVAVGDTAEYRNIRQKVHQTSQWLKERLEVGQTPLVTSTEYGRKNNLESMAIDIANDYSRSFYNATYRTIGLPHDTLFYYDSKLNAFLKQIFAFKHPIDTLPGDVWRLNERTVFDSLLAMDGMMLVDATRQVSWISMESIPEFGLDPIGSGYRNVMTATTLVGHHSPQEQFTESIENFPNPMTQDAYVFGNAFYDAEDAVQYPLLQLIDQHYDKARLDPTLLKSTVEESYGWPAHYRFYYQPILLVLLRMEARK